jgi:hypothetical protein
MTGRNLYAGAHPLAVREIKGLVEAVIQGDRIKKEILLERLGTIDGVTAFANLTNVKLQGSYAQAPKIWPQFAQRTTVADFRDINWGSLGEDFSNFKAEDKGVTRAPNTLPKVAEGEAYQAFALTSSTLGWSVDKFGAQIGFTWENFVNDPFNTVARIPKIMLNAAVRTEDATATRALYTIANANTHLQAVTAPNSLTGVAVAVNGSLTYDALVEARRQYRAKKDARGNYIQSGNIALVVGPALRPVAEAILAQTTVIRQNGSATNFTQTTAVATLGDITIVENPYLDFFAGNSTTWILTPAGGDSGNSAGDPSIAYAFLAGEEEPEVRVSGLAGYTTSGNALPFTSGSFDRDTFDMRVRMVGGAGAVASQQILLSNGTNA